MYRAVLPEAQRVIGRAGTQMVERDNANTRHESARMARHAKVVSKSLTMEDLSIKLGGLFADPAVYAQWQEIFVSVFTEHSALPLHQFESQSPQWGACITRASRGEELHLYTVQVVKDISPLCPSSLAFPPFRGNGSQHRLIEVIPPGL